MTGTRPLDWLRPRPVEPLREQVDEARAHREWGRREGLVVDVWPGVQRARDLEVTPRVRVAAVAPLVPAGAVLVRQSAVWVHTGGHRPWRLDVVLPGGRHRSSRLVQVHAERLDPRDVLALGPGGVSSVARTAVDLARWSEPQDYALGVRSLVEVGLDAHDLAAALERAAGLPGVTRARHRLARVISAASRA